MSYQSKDTGIHGRQLVTKQIDVVANLVTAVSDLPSNILIDNTDIAIVIITLSVNEPVGKCFSVKAINRATNAVLPLLSAPDISVAQKITVTVDGTAQEDVALEFSYTAPVA